MSHGKIDFAGLQKFIIIIIIIIITIINIIIIIKNSYIGLLAKLSVKFKRSECFALNNHMQKLRFHKLSSERSFCKKEFVKLRICDYKSKNCLSHLLEKYTNVNLKISLYFRICLKAIL